MKLFTKTFFFFICLIILQAGLTIFIITNIIQKSNLEDAKEELTEEATSAYDSFNSWKRSIWIELIALGNDERLRGMLPDLTPFQARMELFPYLKEKVLTSGIDSLVIASAEYPHLEVIPRKFSIFTLQDVKKLRNRKDHPYLETVMVGSSLSLVGVTKIAYGASVMDLFMIKQIDVSFCNHLITNRRSQVSFYMEDAYVVGSSESMASVPSSFFTGMKSAYEEHYDEDIERNSHNIAVQKLGIVRVEEEEQSLFLSISLSNLPYQRRLNLVKRTILSVSALGFVLTAVLSLFLSKNLSRPIRNLLNAMHKVKNGQYDTAITPKSKTEIGELSQGFNEMAQQLMRDKIQMENYIEEIVMLKDYSEKIIHSLRAGIAIVNQDLVIEKANSSFLNSFGLDENGIIGKRIQDTRIGIIDREIIRNIRSLIRQKRDFFTKVKRAPDWRIFEIKLYPLSGIHEQHNEASGCVFTVEDISEKMELEQKIIQAEKLSSLSVLSAGVAHEINNPLSSIMSNVQNLIEEERQEHKKTALKYIEQETRRIARTVRELLNFSSAVSESESGSDVNSVIAKVVNLIQYSLGRNGNISIQTSLGDDLPAASISEDELQQIILNLVTNSIQAVDSEGLITVSTVRDASNGRICISVADNGEGIHEEHIPHIFDPFFTTKRNGEGTGLGLSVVYGIVKKYNGTVKIDSTEHRGTKVRIELPPYRDTG